MVSPATNEPPLADTTGCANGNDGRYARSQIHPAIMISNFAESASAASREPRSGNNTVDVERLSDKHVTRPVRRPRFALLTKVSFEQAPSPHEGGRLCRLAGW